MLEHSANASAIVEYKGKRKFGKIPVWIRKKQLEKYYASMDEFYSECLAELKLPSRIDKKEMHAKLMASLRNLIREDKDFTALITKLIENFPTFPLDNKTASEYVIALKHLCARVSAAGLKLNEEIAWDALRSNIPFIVFSNLYLGDYTVSYFHEYRAKTTEQHFRRNHFLIRGRTNLWKRKVALSNYSNKMKTAEDLFKTFMKAQFKLWLYITLSTYADAKDFPNNPQEAGAYEINQEYLLSLGNKHEAIMDEMRRYLYDVEPTLFNPTMYNHIPTETLWKDMVLISNRE